MLSDFEFLEPIFNLVVQRSARAQIEIQIWSVNGNPFVKFGFLSLGFLEASSGRSNKKIFKEILMK